MTQGELDDHLYLYLLQRLGRESYIAVCHSSVLQLCTMQSPTIHRAVFFLVQYDETPLCYSSIHRIQFNHSRINSICKYKVRRIRGGGGGAHAPPPPKKFFSCHLAVHAEALSTCMLIDSYSACVFMIRANIDHQLFITRPIV